MSGATLSPAELAVRVRARGVPLDERLALDTLRYWEARGIAEERLGRWRLTPAGQAMFAGFVSNIVLDDEELVA